jgi:hypothetical protein
MGDLRDEFETDADETTFAQGRLDSRTYASRSFPLSRTNSADDGEPARFVYKVFDPSSQTSLTADGDEWIVRETPAGRYQLKLLVAREPGNVKEIWIQRVPAQGSGASAQTLVNLRQPEVSRFLELVRMLDAFPIEGDTSVRLDDAVIRDLLSDPDSLGRLYHRAPQQVRDLIRNDEAARDVLAIESRRRAVDRFRRLLDDVDYFDRQVTATPRGRPEDVWQALFEANPWMLGVTLTGQLLTSWSDDRLEQVVVGASFAGIGKRADALLHTAGRIRSMVFAEIKTHRTPLLGSEYRSGCWAASSEIVGAVAQSHGTVHRAERQIGERLADVGMDGTDLPSEFTYLLRPRTFVVAGDLAQLVGDVGGHHQDKIRSFELFRRHVREPEILTFDEVLARAEWALDLAEDVEDAP